MVNSQVTTVTLTANTPLEVKFSAAYPYIWVDNKSASDVYASVGGVPEADRDGTYTIAAGSQMRISGGAYSSCVTLLGEGKVQVVASGIASCPFKSASGGGDTKYVNGIPPVNGSIALTQSLIPSDGKAYQMPYFVQSGTVTVGRSAYQGIDITFAKAFKDAPLMFFGTSVDGVTSQAPFVIAAGYRDVTANGFKLFARRSSSGVLDDSYPGVVNWYAFGQMEV